MNKKKIAIFANVVFETSSNRSVQNVVEGFLKRNCNVSYYTTHPYECEYMRDFANEHHNFEIIYINKRQATGATTESKGSGITSKIKSGLKKVLKYKKYQSNTDIIEWFGLYGSYKVIKKLGMLMRQNEDSISNYDGYLFVDKFGGMFAHYLRVTNPLLWNKIADKTVGYYLGTVLKQFGSSKIKAFLVMPINFLGSYRVPLNKLIITDDGTDGERVFRNCMEYRKEILFIRNGIDKKLLDYKPRVKTSVSKHLAFVTCSRLSAWKRIDRAIKFIHQLKSRFDGEIRLTIIGDGEELGRLQDLVNSLGMQRTVTFAGALMYDKVLEVMDMHDYCIVFNDLSALGNQIYESIKLDLIPLVIDDGSTDSLLINDYNAFKFPMCADFETSAAEIFSSKFSQDYNDNLINNLRLTKEQLFSWETRNQLQYDFIFSK